VSRPFFLAKDIAGLILVSLALFGSGLFVAEREPVSIC
jgi:hypothetical protein